MMSWEEYYRLNQGRSVRPILTEALKFTGEGSVESDAPFAIELGCGAGVETAELLRKGWRVMAIDREKSSIEALQSYIPHEARNRLEPVCQGFEELPRLPKANLVFSFHSLPFCKADHFPALLENVKQAVEFGGYFAGTLFGINDDWFKAGHVSGLNSEGLSKFLEEFEILQCAETDRVGPTAMNGDKHWHYWTIIAKRIT